jgi:hypothetical protein
MPVEEKINKMARLEEKGAGKALRCNTGNINRTTSAYRIMQSEKGRARQRSDMAALLDIRKYKKQRRCLFRRHLSSVW